MIIDFKAHVMPGMDKTSKNRIATIRRLMSANSDGPVFAAVSYNHLRAHETDSHLVCRLLLEKKKKTNTQPNIHA